MWLRIQKWWIKRKSYAKYVSPIQKMVSKLQKYVDFQQEDINMMKMAILYKENEIAFSTNSIEALSKIAPVPSYPEVPKGDEVEETLEDQS